MKHYGNPISRAATTLWMLEELDVPHEQIIVDFAAAEQQSPDPRGLRSKRDGSRLRCLRLCQGDSYEPRGSP